MSLIPLCRLPRRVAVVLATATTAASLVGVVSSSAAAATPVFEKTLGGPSIASMYPSGLDFDAKNDRLVVADTGRDRVLFYSTTGVRQGPGFGSYGTADGQFASPRDVAVDPATGNIYVADAENNRVQAFTETGTLRWQRGGIGACDTCLNTPIGVGWDAANATLLVASTGQSLIKAFDGTGGFKWKSPTGNTLVAHAMRDVTRGPDGRIWISAYKEHQIKAYDVTAAGVWTSAPAIVLGDGAANANGDNQLNFPYNVSFSPDGATAYVSDTGNGRIARYSISGTTAQWMSPPLGGRCDEHPQPCQDPPADAGQFNHLRRTVTGPDGAVYAADFWGNGVEVFTASGASIRQIEGASAPAPGFSEAYSVDTGPDGSIYALDRLNHRIERFTSEGGYLRSAGARGTQDDTFSWPEALAVDPTTGDVWVADTRGDRVQKWPANLTTSATIPSVGSSGSAAGQFNYPEGIDVYGGQIYIADTRNDRLQRYDPAAKTFTVIGTSGAGDGQLKQPRGVAVNASGIYVADSLNNRVQKFGLDGTFQTAYSTGLSMPEGIDLAPDGTVWVADTLNNRVVHLSAGLTDLGDGFGGGGTGNLQFDQPHDIAVTATKLIVADTYNDRVQVYKTAEEPPPPPPLGVPLPDFTAQISNPGGVAPLYPAGGAADSSGTRYVADSGGSRIVTLDSAGVQSVLSTTGWNDPRDLTLDVADPSVLWVADTGDSQLVKISTTGGTLATYGGRPTLNQPYGVSNDATKVYLADTYGNAVRALNKSDGTVAWSVTSCSGTSLSRPRDATVGSDGNIYVTDTDNDRVAVVSPTGACTRTFGSRGTGNGQFQGPRSIVSDGSAGIWVADAFNYRVQHFGSDGTFVAATPQGAFGDADGQLRSPNCLFLDGALLSVCDTYNYRIARYTVSATGVPTFASNLGGTKPGHGGFNGPFATAYGPAGELHVVDWFNQRLQKFNADRSFTLQFGGYGNKPGSLIFPRGVLVDSSGNLVVTDSENNRIDRFSVDGVFLESVKPAAGSKALSRPHQSALDAAGNYWIADTNGNRIVALDPGGTVLQNWNAAGQFGSPQGIAVAADGKIYVSNTEKNTIERYNPDQSGRVVVAASGTADGKVNKPAGLLITDSVVGQLLWIADAGNHRVQVLRLDTNAVVATFGSLGSGDGHFSNPKAVAVDPTDGDIAVADFGNNRVSVWSYSGGTPPPPPDTTAPDGTVTVPSLSQVFPSGPVTMSGAATDNRAVTSVSVGIKDSAAGTWLQPDGTWATKTAFVPATLATPGATSTNWSYSFAPPKNGAYGLSLRVDDAAGNTDPTRQWVTFKVGVADTTPAHGVVTKPTANQSLPAGVITLEGLGTDNTAVGSVKIAVRAASTPARYLKADGTWTTAFTTVTTTLASPGSVSTPWTYTWANATPGTYFVTPVATDTSGNVEPQASRQTVRFTVQ